MRQVRACPCSFWQGVRAIQGFTLFELLIVLLIIGIITSFATLATGDFGQSKRVESSVLEFRQILLLAEQQSILNTMEIGVSINQQGYRFYRLDTRSSQPGWIFIKNDPWLHAHNWPAGINISMANSGSFANESLKINNPQLIITESGDLTPFKLIIKKQKKALFEVNSQANGQITITKFAT